MKYFYGVIGFLMLGYIAINIPQLGRGEIMSAGTFVITLLVSWFVFKKDLTGMFVAAMILGVTVEWLTEAYWDYHLNVYIVRDISFFIIMGWGYSFTFFVLISNAIYKKVFHCKEVALFDKRILIFDIIIGPLWFISNEFVAMKMLHLWDYSECARWNHIIPVLDYPFEAFIASILFALVFPSFVRYWGKEFQLTGSSSPKP